MDNLVAAIEELLKSLDRAGEIDGYGKIGGEEGVFGVELADGQELFIEVKRA